MKSKIIRIIGQIKCWFGLHTLGMWVVSSTLDTALKPIKSRTGKACKYCGKSYD